MNIHQILQNYKVKCFCFINATDQYNNEINNYVKNIYVINLKKNKLRRNYIIVLMKKLNINFKLLVVESIDNEIYEYVNIKNNMSKSEAGCLLSHLWCLKRIIEKKHRNSIIFEDDIIFHKKFTELFINLYNPNIHFLMLGACDFSFSKIHKSKVVNNLYTVDANASNVFGSHANYYSLQGAKIMFEYKCSNISFFDKNYFDVFKKMKNSAFICYPNLVVSDISTTDIGHEYPFFSISEENYYNKCFVNFDFNDYYFIYLDFFLKNQNIIIAESDDYPSYMNKIIYSYFYNNQLSANIKERLVWDFFTIDDLKCILSIFDSSKNAF